MKQLNKRHRIFINTSININQEICCPQETMHHIKKVLRVKKNEKIIIFNGNGEEFEGHLINRKDEKIKITGLLKKANKTDKKIILAQCISSNKHMDFAIQKSVEIGIDIIVPVISIRSPPGNHLKKKEHWKKIIIHAIEQSHGLFIPELFEIIDFKKIISHEKFKNFHKILFHQSGRRIIAGDSDSNHIIFLIGPEGGFDHTEIEDATKENWNIISLGDRVLRTETAAIVAQTLLKDF